MSSVARIKRWPLTAPRRRATDWNCCGVSNERCGSTIVMGMGVGLPVEMAEGVGVGVAASQTRAREYVDIRRAIVMTKSAFTGAHGS